MLPQTGSLPWTGNLLWGNRMVAVYGIVKTGRMAHDKADARRQVPVYGI
ncbi:hypothetical protein IL314_15515 [Enterococcus faecium]|nr:hypothetical protein [Enterococcus faecium]